MPRVPEVDPADASQAQRALFESDLEVFGEILSASRVYAHQPEVFARVQELHEALWKASTLPEPIVRKARLRVAEIHRSPF
jgi:hypothetical protein